MKVILFLCVLGFSVNASAQNGVKPMIKQIALLKTYIIYLEKGYDIARKGLSTISDIKNGHWGLDTQFFNSLKVVNPKIKSYAKVAAILDLQRSVIKVCGQLKKMDFNPGETAYINTVIIHLLEETEKLGRDLEMTLTDHVLHLSDDERIQHIDRIYGEAKEQYSFIQHFSNEARVLIIQRAKEKNDIRISQKLRGL